MDEILTGTFEAKTPGDLRHVAKSLMPWLNKGTVFAFYGDLGAGKTTLIKEICKFLNVTDVVNSPTFAIVNEYRVKNAKSVYHFDFYRIKTIDEVYDLGYEDYFFSYHYCFIEWPGKIESLLPEGTISVYIEVASNNSRIIRIEQHE